MVFGAISTKKYYGYVINVSREQLEEVRERRGITKDEFIEVIINFLDEKKSIKLDYNDFRRRLL